MNNKHYVGKNAQSFEQYDDVTISGVTLNDGSGAQFSVGDKNGYVLPITCKYATQQMADDLFRLLGGKIYRGYRATNATLDPMAELGDGVTINGVYSVLAYRRVNFGPEHMSEIAAPGEGDLNHEYQMQSYTSKGIEQSQEETKKEIEDTADKLRDEAKDIADKAVADQTQEDIFNKLTGGGVDQGIYLQQDESGVTKVYINLEYLKSNIIDLNKLYISGSVSGKAIGLMKGYGETATGRTTEGVVMYGNGTDGQENANPPYLIVTDAGIRAQSTETNDFNVAGGTAEMNGELKATGNVVAGGSLYAGNMSAAQYDSSDTLMIFGNNSFRSWVAGRQTYLGEYVRGYTADVRGETVTITASKINETVQPTITSDEMEKKDIVPIPDAYIRVFDNISPVLFRYKFEDDDAPLHMGYTTQNVQSALSCAGMTGADMAALGNYENENGEQRMALAYGELIALLHLKIKSLQNEINMIKENLKNEH